MNANFSKPDWMIAANAFDEPRLARGLVREELRSVADPSKNPAYRPLRNYMNRLVDKHMPPTGKFSTATAAKLMKLLVKEAHKHLQPIKQFETSVFIQDDDAKASPLHGFFYWLRSKAKVNFGDEEKEFVGDFIELRCMRISGSRRRLMFDDAFCHFNISEHCLARMLERGAAPRDALKDLTSQFDNVLPTAMIFAAAYKSGHHNEFPHILIPYKDGILLCKVVLMDLTEEDFAKWHRFRIVADKVQTGPRKFPNEPVLLREKGGRMGAVSIYAATYVPRMQMSSEQIWAQMQIQQLMEDERPYFDSYMKLVYMLEDLDAALPPHLPEIFRRMEKIMHNPRWKLATSAMLLAQNS